MCQNSKMRVNGAWIEMNCVLCSKTYNTLYSCHNFLAGSRQAARGARICETSLLGRVYRAVKHLSVCVWCHACVVLCVPIICLFTEINLRYVIYVKYSNTLE